MKMYVAVPVHDEDDWVWGMLNSLVAQTGVEFDVWLCVNQPDDWWSGPEWQRQVCERNADLLSRLRKFTDLPLEIIDCCSPGSGWKKGRGGVGRARKTIMDAINSVADDSDIIVSLDADTLVGKDYLLKIADLFRSTPGATGLSAPYHHNLVQIEDLDRAILRYEIYLRYYALNMWRIGSPYSFTAIGSAMACPVSAFRKIRGITPRESGEDFYFLQQLQKAGRLLHWIDSEVYPGVRFSERVAFGTGSAMKKGFSGDWTSYPLFPVRLFDDIGETVDLFPELFYHDIETPVTEFLKAKLNTSDLWGSLRRNFKDQTRFIRACHERLDGLRIFQYLRSENESGDGVDERNIAEYLEMYCAGVIGRSGEAGALCAIIDGVKTESFRFVTATTGEMDVLRLLLKSCENEYRRSDLERLKHGGKS